MFFCRVVYIDKYVDDASFHPNLKFRRDKCIQLTWHSFVLNQAQWIKSDFITSISSSGLVESIHHHGIRTYWDNSKPFHSRISIYPIIIVSNYRSNTIIAPQLSVQWPIGKSSLSLWPSHELIRSSLIRVTATTKTQI